VPEQSGGMRQAGHKPSTQNERGKNMEIYNTRYQAKKAVKETCRDCKVAKVEGGYAVMEWSEYYQWIQNK